MQDHLEESCVHQVQDSVLYSADVLVDVHPVIDLCRIECCLVVFGVAVSEEVPGRIKECIHGIDLSLGFASALRAAAFSECL